MREKTPDVDPCHYMQASIPLSHLHTRSLTIPLMTSPSAQTGRSEVLGIKTALYLIQLVREEPGTFCWDGKGERTQVSKEQVTDLFNERG